MDIKIRDFLFPLFVAISGTAQSVSVVCKKPYSNALKRIKHTSQQAHLSRQKRKTNMSNAFSLNTQSKTSIFGKNILLIDGGLERQNMILLNPKTH